MARDFAKSFYSSGIWQRCRDGYTQSRAHLCENCLRKGVYRPGEIVHHKIEMDPVTINNPELALGWDNLMLLCRECHAEAHDKRKQGRRYTITSEGKVIVNGEA